MKGFDKIRDILYDSIDYVFMFAILIIVTLVIGWRLDVLFAKDALEIPDNPSIIVDNSERPVEIPQVPDESTDEPEQPPDVSEVAEEPEDPQVEDPAVPAPPPQTVSVKVVIPEGSLPGKIGLILEDAGVISSSRDFLTKVVEMKLDTKLRSGTFNIQKGISLEEVIKTITK